MRNKLLWIMLFTASTAFMWGQSTLTRVHSLGKGALSNTTYYSKATGDVNVLSTWGIGTDGSGTAPTSFTADQQTFIVCNRDDATLSADWTVSGTDSGIIVGDGTNVTVVDVGSGLTLTAPVSVAANSWLTIASDTLPTIVALDPTSTLTIIGSGTTTIPSMTTGNLVIYNGTKIFSGSTLTVNGNLTLGDSGVTTDLTCDSTSKLYLAGNLNINSALTYTDDNRFSFQTLGDGDQTFTGNNNSFETFDFKSSKTAGSLTLSANTPISTLSDFGLAYSGLGEFYDGGNLITVGGDVAFDNSADYYFLSGTLDLNGSRAQNIYDATNFATDSRPKVVFATIKLSGTGDVTFYPISGSGVIQINGNLEILSSFTGKAHFVNNAMYISGDYIDECTTDPIDKTTNYALVFVGYNQQNVWCSRPEGESHNTIVLINYSGMKLNCDLSTTGMFVMIYGFVDPNGYAFTCTDTLEDDNHGVNIAIGTGTVTGFSATVSNTPVTIDTITGITKTWDIEGTPSGDVTMTLTWAATKDNGIHWATTTPVVYYRLDASSPWTALTPTSYDCTSDPRSVTFTTNHFSEWTIVPSSLTLPVTLTNFSGTIATNGSVQLSWTTQTESDMLGYNVWRAQSADFDTAEQINGANLPATNLSIAHTYSYNDATVVANTTYNYWIEGVELNGHNHFYGPIVVHVTSTPDTPNIPDTPFTTALLNCSPNPAGAGQPTAICYSLQGSDGVAVDASLSVYNLRGQLVKTIFSGQQLPGERKFAYWNGTDRQGHLVSSGMYFFKLVSGKTVCTHKLAIIK